MTSEYFFYTTTCILLILTGVKTYLYFSSTTHRRFQNWFFFTNYAIYNSRNDKSRKLKVFQNKLSLFLLTVLVIDLVLMVIFRSSK